MLDICGIVLGSQYLYNRKAIFYREYNRYHLTKYGIEYIVHEHRMKTNLFLVSASQMKRLVNASKNFILMIVKVKYVEQTESFKGCDLKLKKDLIKWYLIMIFCFKNLKGYLLKDKFNMKFIYNRMHLFLILVCTDLP